MEFFPNNKIFFKYTRALTNNIIKLIQIMHNYPPQTDIQILLKFLLVFVFR